MSSQELFGKTLEELAREQKERLQQAELERKRNEAAAAKRREEEAKEKQRLDELNKQFFQDGEEVTPESLVEKIAQLPDFTKIRTEFNSIPDLMNRWMYIDRMVAERIPEAFPMVLHNVENGKKFHYLLREIEIPLLCPFYHPKKKSLTGEICLITGSEIDASCGGRNDICKVFEDSMQKASRGEITIQFPQAKIQAPSECLVDLEELRKYWEGEDD